MFNALQYTKSLEESGFERDQAEILVRMFMQMIEFNMLSKSDFEKFKSDFEKYKLESKSNLDSFRYEWKSDLEKLSTEVYHRFDKFDDKLNRLSLQLTVKLGVMLALSVGLLSTILAIKL